MATIEARHHGDGSKSYRVKIRLRGVQESETFDRKTDAKEWAARRETEIRQGLRFAGTRKTLGEAIDRYLREELPGLAVTVHKGRRLHLDWWGSRRGSVLLTDWSLSRCS
jgi:hypothetical protein